MGGGEGEDMFYSLIITSLGSSLGVFGVRVWASLVMLKHLKTNVSDTFWMGC